MNKDLSNQNLADISPLAKMTGLNKLWLYNNKITDISPLAGMTNLKWLDLASNQIAADQIYLLMQAIPTCGIGTHSESAQ